MCWFKESCAYKHEKDTNQNNSVKHLITNHEKEISTMKHELNQMKAVVSQMGDQIMRLSQELERTVKNSVKEIIENCSQNYTQFQSFRNNIWSSNQN